MAHISLVFHAHYSFRVISMSSKFCRQTSFFLWLHPSKVSLLDFSRKTHITCVYDKLTRQTASTSPSPPLERWLREWREREGWELSWEAESWQAEGWQAVVLERLVLLLTLGQRWEGWRWQRWERWERERWQRWEREWWEGKGLGEGDGLVGWLSLWNWAGHDGGGQKRNDGKDLHLEMMCSVNVVKRWTCDELGEYNQIILDDSGRPGLSYIPSLD